MPRALLVFVVSVFPSGHPPAACPAGHYTMPGRVLVGWLTCTSCVSVHEAGVLGHVTVSCRADVGGRECGLVTYDPAPHVDRELHRGQR